MRPFLVRGPKRRVLEEVGIERCCEVVIQGMPVTIDDICLQKEYGCWQRRHSQLGGISHHPNRIFIDM